MSGNLKTLEEGIKARTHSSDVGFVYISPRSEQVGQMLGYMKYYTLVDLLTASDMGVSGWYPDWYGKGHVLISI